MMAGVRSSAAAGLQETYLVFLTKIATELKASNFVDIIKNSKIFLNNKRSGNLFKLRGDSAKRFNFIFKLRPSGVLW